MKKTDDGKYEVQASIVHHKGIIARYRMEYPTKRHARWAQHLICTVNNVSRLRCSDELKALIEKGGSNDQHPLIRQAAFLQENSVRRKEMGVAEKRTALKKKATP